MLSWGYRHCRFWALQAFPASNCMPGLHKDATQNPIEAWSCGPDYFTALNGQAEGSLIGPTHVQLGLLGTEGKNRAALVHALKLIEEFGPPPASGRDYWAAKEEVSFGPDTPEDNNPARRSREFGKCNWLHSQVGSDWGHSRPLHFDFRRKHI
ncbi:hypothetical protein NDU88_000533 [Pleurodeles waltl]|uniref:Uncharacterized protein n=1 Tax=Pleurodeles waltl TaxID=8319 RepID=A0AAV7P479_PLEWA|nr:hypothetical protein NDU88_000533 [Pleurodeles waltl]